MKIAQRLCTLLDAIRIQEAQDAEQEKKITDFMKREVPFLSKSHPGGRAELRVIPLVLSQGKVCSTDICFLFRDKYNTIMSSVWIRMSSKDFEGPAIVSLSQKDITNLFGQKIQAFPKKEYKTFELALKAIAEWVKKNEKGIIPKS